MSLDFATASSRPCLAVFLPLKMFSICSSIASRTEAKLPSRMPWLFGVVLPDCICLMAVSCCGFFEKWPEASIAFTAAFEIDKYPVTPAHHAWLSVDARYLKNCATPLYSSGFAPFSTQSVAPPMIELPCGKPARRGRGPVAHVNLPSEAFVRLPMYADEVRNTPHSPLPMFASALFSRPL